MSLISELIEGASGDKAVTELLRKVKVVAARADVPALDEWVEHELNGYPDGSNLPDYRGPLPTEVFGSFGGYFGSSLNNAPIPSIALPSQYRNGGLFSIAFTQPIAVLEELSDGDDVIRFAWPANVLALVNSLVRSGEMYEIYQDMGLQQAWRSVSRTTIVQIIEAVRNRILDLALTMEKSNPETGQPDAPPLPPKDQQNIVTHIYGSSNVAVASTNVSQAINFEPGDQDGLKRYLTSVGVPDDYVQSLLKALEADGEVDTEMGPETKNWLGNLMADARKLGIGAGGALIAKAVLHYLGIG